MEGNEITTIAYWRAFLDFSFLGRFEFKNMIYAVMSSFSILCCRSGILSVVLHFSGANA